MGGVGECGKAKISLSEPRSGGTFLDSTANGKKSRGGVGEGWCFKHGKCCKTVVV